MGAQLEISPQTYPLPGLLEAAKSRMLDELHARLAGAGFDDIRPTHGCVFRFVDRDGIRLTDLAELAGMTKQACGEILDDAQRLGYVERIADPADRRAKLVILTDRGRAAQAAGREIFAAIEAEWAERYGASEVASMRALLEEIERDGHAPSSETPARRAATTA